MFIIHRHKHAFAYTFEDMPGYHGNAGDFEIPLVQNNPIVTRRRASSDQL